MYGSATGPMVTAAPAMSSRGHHSLLSRSRRVTASELARCHATAPDTYSQQSMKLACEYQPQ